MEPRTEDYVQKTDTATRNIKKMIFMFYYLMQAFAVL